jgi:branched-chain amino acid transport system substrate-binding protein
MRRSRYFIGAAAAVMLVTATACSSAGGSSATSTSPASTGATSSASTGNVASTGSTIPIGVIGSYSGSQASSTGGVPMVAQAWADTVNAAGGLDGHKIQLFVEDDAGNPATGIQDANVLVQQDKVVAIVGDASNVDSAWAPIVEKAGVPVVGGLSLNETFLSNPDFFASGTNIIALQYGLVATAKKFGGSIDLLYCAEAAACKEGATLTAAIAKTDGVSVPFQAPVSSTAPDYTAVCQEVKSSGAKTYDILDAGVLALRIATACEQQGVTARLVQVDSQITQAFDGVAAVNNTYAVEIDAPWFDSSTPATDAYQTAIAKYAPTLGQENGPEANYQWVAGQLFEAAVKASGSSTVTAASVKQGLYALKGETLGGLTQPLTFTKGQTPMFNCWFTMAVVGEKFALPSGLTTECAPTAVVAAIAKSM